MALLEKAAGQGHAYATYELGGIHHTRRDYKQAVEWTTQAAEAGLPNAIVQPRDLARRGAGRGGGGLPGGGGLVQVGRCLLTPLTPG